MIKRVIFDNVVTPDCVSFNVGIETKENRYIVIFDDGYYKLLSYKLEETTMKNKANSVGDYLKIVYYSWVQDIVAMHDFGSGNTKDLITWWNEGKL